MAGHTTVLAPADDPGREDGAGLAWQKGELDDEAEAEEDEEEEEEERLCRMVCLMRYLR
jgi:hypothetical protein